MNTERLICGLAVPFGEASVDGELRYTADHFRRFVELETALPVMFRHEPGITCRGAVIPHHGTARRFALLAAAHGDIPAGLLTLAEVDATPMGDGLLAEVERGLRDPWSPHSLTGLSLAVNLLYDESGTEVKMAWPSELSLCHAPRFEAARVCAVGPAAWNLWSLLTAGTPRPV